MKKLITAIVSVALISSGIVAVTAAPASAKTVSFQIAWTKIGLYPRSAPAMDASKVGTALPDGAWIEVACETTGASVTSDAATSTIWEKLTDGTYVSNAFVKTGSDGWSPGVARCDAAPAVTAPTQKFDRNAAVRWAAKHVNDKERFKDGNDCAWYVSQALWAGRIPKTADWTNRSKDFNNQASRKQFPGPTKAAGQPDFLKNALVNAGYATITEIDWKDRSAGGAQLGDVLLYDWNDAADGFIDHAAVVTTIEPDGMVEVSQHSPARVDKAWAFDPDAKANVNVGKPAARAYLLHITY